MGTFQQVPSNKLTNTTWSNLSISDRDDVDSKNLMLWLGCPLYAIAVNLIISILCQCFKKLVMPNSGGSEIQEWPNQLEVKDFREYHERPPLSCITPNTVVNNSKKSTWEISFHTICCSYRVIYSCRKCRLKPSQSELKFSCTRDENISNMTQTSHSAVQHKKPSEGSAATFPIQRPTSGAVIKNIHIGPQFPVTGVFCICLLAVFDMLHLISDYITPFVLHSSYVQERVSSKTIFNLDCRLRFVLRVFTRIIVEWTLVVFGVERLLMVIQSTTRARAALVRKRKLPQLDVLKMKLGMSLFIVIIFAACNNYLLIIGQMFAMKDVNGQNSDKLILLCQIRKEFQPFYEKFLKYVELIAFSFIPQFITFCLVISIVLVYLVRCCCLRQREIIRQSNFTLEAQCQGCSGWCTALYCIQVLFRISLQSPAHLNNIIRILFNQQLNHKSKNLEQHLAMVRLTITSTSTLILLMAIIYQHRKCIRKLNLDRITSHSSPTDTDIHWAQDNQTDSV